MKKKYVYLLVVNLLAMPHVTYLMEEEFSSDDDKTTETGSSSKGESSSSREGSPQQDSSSSSSSEAHEERVRNLSKDFVKNIRNQLQKKRKERQHFFNLFDSADKETYVESCKEGYEDRATAWENKSRGTWRKEKEKLDRLVNPRRLKRIDTPDDNNIEKESEGYKEPTSLRSVRDKNHKIRRSRSFLDTEVVIAEKRVQPKLLPSGHDTRRGSLEDKKIAWRMGYQGSSVGKFDLSCVDRRRSRHDSFGLPDNTFINLPPGSHLSIPDPDNPGHEFIVRSRAGSIVEQPEVLRSGSRRESGSHKHASHHHDHDRPSRDRFPYENDSPEPRFGGGDGRRNDGINYDQIYRFRNYPLVALLILSFDRYPKTTLLAVGLATAIVVWKYRAFMDFLEKAKEKTMGTENGKQNQLSSSGNSKKKSEALNRLKAALSRALKKTWYVLA